MAWKIGVDGGGTKTESILVDPSGAVAARHTGRGCSPSLVGAALARRIAAEAIRAVRPSGRGARVASTLLCMAGSREFWRDFGGGLRGCGRVTTFDDSLPVLELGTRGGPGLVLHAGTGSFIAARTADGALHYAGGIGWRFGDEGGGYELGRRAVARALLEMQGWAEPSGLGRLVRKQSGARSLAEIERRFYGDPRAPAGLADLAAGVLRLAEEGDPAAAGAVSESLGRLLALAVSVARRLFPGRRPRSFRAAVSGPILNHPFSLRLLRREAPFPLERVTEPPIEGVRRLLARSAE